MDGERMFGPGTYELLQHIAATGSLHQAATLMGMSYTKAWHLLRDVEEHLGWKLVERQVGGVSGGGTSLTPLGRALVERFSAFMTETDAAIRATFEMAFGDWPPADPGGGRA
jgi:molybdate transport system regulatory protein